MTTLTLRPYQVDALARIEQARERGARGGLLVAATGLGKTVMFCSLAERWRARTLILAHRDELVGQAAAKVAEVYPEASVGVVKGKRDERHADVVVASVQTLAQPTRLARLPTVTGDAPTGGLFGPERPFDLLVVDEAHHAAADSYRAVIRHLGAGSAHPDGPWLLGVTATPDRGDKVGLDDLFDEVLAAYDLTWGIRAGYLCDLTGIAVRLAGFDPRSVKVSAGDYQAGAAGRALQAAHASEHIVDAWQQRAAGRRTLAFTATVAQSIELRDTFRDAGITAEHLDGKTPMDERRLILDRFADGDVDVVTNCAVLTEGYDNPAVDCIVVARPTKSRALYVQMVGRGTRLHPDKETCLVLDVVGASDEHSLVTAPSLFGLTRAEARDGYANLGEAAAAHDAERLAAGDLTLDDVDLFASVRARGGIAWVPIHMPGSPLRRYHRTLPTKDGKPQPTVVLAQRRPNEDVWTAGLLYPDGTKRGILVDVPLTLAQGAAEEHVRRTGGTLGALSAKWRTHGPTVKQRDFARTLGIRVEPGWTAGDLSDAIDQHLGRRRLGWARRTSRR